MRKLRDLDEEIRRAERRLEARREELNVSLHASRVRARRTLTSPQVLLGAVVAGFLIDRLGRLKPRKAAEHKPSGGMAGIVAGLGAAALRSALSNPGMWQSLRRMWTERKTHERARAAFADASSMPGDLHRHPAPMQTAHPPTLH